MSRATQSYATRNDWSECLRMVEAQRPLAYTVSGLFDAEDPESFIGVDAVPNFGCATMSNSLLEPCYLVHDSDREIQTRQVPQRRGGLKYAIDQRLNPFAVGLRPGGLLTDDILIAGQLGTSTRDPASIELHKLIIRELKRRFVCIKSYWVGPEAVRLLDHGGRLTISYTPDTTFDLVR